MHRTHPSWGRITITWVEVSLAVAVIVAICAFAWPVLQGVSDIAQLRKAGRAIEAEWTDARIKAMRTTQIHLFRFEPDTDWYVIETLDEWNPDLAVFDPDAAPRLAERAQIDEQGRAKHLPPGATFQTVELADDPRGDILVQEKQPREGAALLAPPVLFYPDGSTSTATLTLQGRGGRYIEIRLDGLTGTVKLGEPGTENDNLVKEPKEEWVEY